MPIAGSSYSKQNDAHATSLTAVVEDPRFARASALPPAFVRGMAVRQCGYLNRSHASPSQ